MPRRNLVRADGALEYRSNQARGEPGSFAGAASREMRRYGTITEQMHAIGAAFTLTEARINLNLPGNMPVLAHIARRAHRSGEMVRSGHNREPATRKDA